MKLDASIAAIVTGGASGLGEATARHLASFGVKVGICDLNAERGEKVAAEIGGAYAQTDVTSDESVGMIAQCSVAMAGLEPLDADGARGVIVNTSSVAGEDGQMGQAAYAASKGGILGLTLPVARDLTGFGIRCCSIQPGIFHTPMFDQIDEKFRISLAAQVPFPSRLGNPKEYAMLVESICRNDYLNGAAIRLDGAIRLQPK